MSIHREELATLDFSDVADSPTESLPVSHPGRHLAKMLGELGITEYRLAKALHVPPRRINEIVHGKRAITADTAIRLGRALDQSPDFWMNLQARYARDQAERVHGKEIEREVEPLEIG
jgi:addiction module HigA family antidote